jgi:organic hydroperoxide reductase OsmC/OhrA
MPEQIEGETLTQPDRFRVVAWWSSGQSGIAKSNSSPSAIHFTSPPSLGGEEGRRTPQDFLLSALVSSYTTTFRGLAEKLHLEHTDLEVEVEGMGDSQGNQTFEELLVRAVLIIPHPEQYAQAMDLLNETSRLCFSSQAPSIKRSFEARVTVRLCGYATG